jgi:selenide,water dikinase
VPLQAWRPQRHWLSILAAGNRYAVATRGPFTVAGRWVWHWKDHIDRRFMRQFEGGA